MAGGSMLMAAMLTSDVQHNLQSAFKGMYLNFQLDQIYEKFQILKLLSNFSVLFMTF